MRIVLFFFLALGFSIPMSPEKLRNTIMGFPDIGAQEPIFLACKVIKMVILLLKNRKFRILKDLWSTVELKTQNITNREENTEKDVTALTR